MKKKKTSVVKKEKSEVQSIESSDKDDSERGISQKVEETKRPRQRQENSLGELTKNFIKYIKEKGDNIVHINELVKKLKVKKRRIYDITNVLEGIGYLKKVEKNKVKWMKDEIGNDNLLWNSNDLSKELEEKKIHLEDLKNEELKLDSYILELKQEFEQITKDEDFQKYGYITHSDLRNLTASENMNIIAIKAPIGTTVEIPDPSVIESMYQKTKQVFVLI